MKTYRRIELGASCQCWLRGFTMPCFCSDEHSAQRIGATFPARFARRLPGVVAQHGVSSSRQQAAHSLIVPPSCCVMQSCVAVIIHSVDKVRTRSQN